MKTLKDVLAVKGTDVLAVKPDDNILDAMRLMTDRGVGALLVMDNGQVSGIVSERDVARKVTLEGKIAAQTKASDIMTDRVACAKLDLTVNEGMAVMTDRRIRHLPVIDGDKVVGVVSIGDLVKAVIDDQKFTIEQLEHYISG